MLLNENINPDEVKKLSLSEKAQLCEEIRGFIIEQVSKTGGHLASNLGAVELTVALHSVFTTPEDKIIFDVGHQAYTHKILTGRYKDFSRLRTEGGISGFPRPDESEHDAFIGGHSSISISAALGISKAMELQGSDKNVIAVIGDGAFTGGQAYEALNNAGKMDNNLIIVLNDNEMSISKNSGALATYLTQITTTKKYVEAKQRVKDFLEATKVGAVASKGVSDTKKLIKYAIYQSNMFEDLGFRYLGPVDGHNLRDLIEVFEAAKLIDKPCIVHVKTKKGKGYRPAEENSGQYHGIEKSGSKSNKILTNSEIFGMEIARLGGLDTRLCVVTAAMKYATGCQYFCKQFRERFFDVGIAEEHAVTFCCGLASQGMIPVFAVYSTFSQRCIDQLIHDAAIEKLHIVLAIDRAGFVGEDGETHQGVFDVSIMSAIPNVTIYSPSNSEELSMCLERAIYDTDGIAVIRYSRGEAMITNEFVTWLPDFSMYGHNGRTLAVTYGRITNYAKLMPNAVADLMQLIRVSPIPDDAIEQCMKYSRIEFFEEGIVRSGIGEKLGFELLKRGYKGRYNVTGVEGEFIKTASVESQLHRYGLDCDGMIKKLSIGELT